VRDFSPVFVRYGSAADITRNVADVRFTPQSGQRGDMLACPLSAISGLTHRNKKAPLFDHLVGDGEQPRWEAEAECPGGVEVDHELKFDRLDNR